MSQAASPSAIDSVSMEHEGSATDGTSAHAVTAAAAAALVALPQAAAAVAGQATECAV